MKSKIFVLFMLVILLNIPTAQAVINPIINGNFETGTTGWSFTGPYSSEYGVTSCAWYIHYAYEGTYFARSFGRGDSGPSCSISQSIDCTELNTITFWNQHKPYWNDKPQHTFTASVGSESITIEKRQATEWKQYSINVEALTGYHTFGVYASTTGTTTNDQIYLMIDLVEGIEAPSYIEWSTFPAESWKVGNYSTLIVSVPTSLSFDFYYKTSSQNDYVLTPIQKSFVGRYFNVDEGCFYEDYIKTCYHAVHGNYSAKLVINGGDSSVTHRYIPYFDPNINIPDVIIIPTPDVFVDPPILNVTIPPKYQNVTWLIDYTNLWDGVGNTTNNILYSTVGLLLIPLDFINESFITVEAYASNASGMITGFEHCSIIINAAWSIIPHEIQKIFIGAAVLGLIVFIYNRRA